MTHVLDLQALVMSVGELKGQTRELVHAANNNTQALNHALAALAKMETLPAEVLAMKARITALEMAEGRRGAVLGFGGWLMGILPMGGLVAIITTLFEFFRGKHP